MPTIRSLANPAAQFRCNAFLRVHSASFHCSTTNLAGRYVRDKNRNRGVSALNRRPKKVQISVAKVPLPEPVIDPQKRSTVDVIPDHGLWGFFHDKKALPTPEEDHKHGRAWTTEELRHKSWEDIQKLWWVCVKERNIMDTQKLERERLKPGYGEFESNSRYGQIKLTQRAIKHVLTERYYVWREALKIASTDEEVDLSGNGPAFTPKDFQDSHEEEEEETLGASTETGPLSASGEPPSPRTTTIL